MLHIHLLGHLRLFEGEQSLKFAALPKTLSLFAYLLLHRAEALPREVLAYTLWPDVPEAEARANLRRHLHDLKRALPPEPPEAPRLLSDHRTVQWNADTPAWLDVAEFERLSADDRRRTEAVALYTGDLLPNVYDDWIGPARERLRQRYLADLGRLVEHYRARQDTLQAIVYADQVLRHDPLREDAARELIALRYAAGDRSGAVREYQVFAARLQEELGTPPMPETTALYDSLAAGHRACPGRAARARTLARAAALARAADPPASAATPSWPRSSAC